MTLSTSDLTTIAKMHSPGDAMRLLADKGVPTHEWTNYLKLVGTNHGGIEVILRDPRRHWLWCLLFLNGCTYRQIGSYYDRSHTTVCASVLDQLHDSARRRRLADKISLEHLSAMVMAFSTHGSRFDGIDPIADALLLHDLAEEFRDR